VSDLSAAQKIMSGQKQPKPAATTAQMRGETFLPMNLNDHVRRNLYFQKLIFLVGIGLFLVTSFFGHSKFSATKLKCLPGTIPYHMVTIIVFLTKRPR